MVPSRFLSLRSGPGQDVTPTSSPRDSCSSHIDTFGAGRYPCRSGGRPPSCGVYDDSRSRDHAGSVSKPCMVPRYSSKVTLIDHRARWRLLKSSSIDCSTSARCSPSVSTQVYPPAVVYTQLTIGSRTSQYQPSTSHQSSTRPPSDFET